MITFIDTNILLDVFLPDPKWGEKSLNCIKKAFEEGILVVNAIVYAELVPQFDDYLILDESLETIGCQIIPLGKEAAYLAGKAWKKYRASGGIRKRVLADFLIGAHASLNADRLLTRDRGFYNTYFTDLKLFSPI